MADLALLGYPAGNVIWICGSLVILEMAGNASRAGDAEIVVDVALVALQAGVSATERESQRSVIDAGRLPCGGVVAVLTSLGKAERHMIGIGCLAKIRQVTTDAGCRGAFVFSAHVATGTIEGGMGSGQSEPGHLQMVELGARPAGDRVALLAARRKSGSHVIGRAGLLIIRGVAGVALE